MKSANLKVRLAFVAAVLVFAATLVVTLSTLAVVERGMKSVIGDQEYTMLSGAASFMDDRMEARRRQVETLAANLTEELRADGAALQRHLGIQASLWGDDYMNLLVVDRKGEIVVTVKPIAAGRQFNARGRDYFDQAIATRKSVISKPLQSRLSKQNIVVFSAPVFDAAGEVAQVLVASVHLQGSGFLRPINVLKPGTTGYLFLMTADGIVIEHPDRNRVMKHISATPGVNRGTLRALQGFEGWIEAHSKDGRASIYAYRRLRSTGWILAARYPTDEAFAPLQEMRRNAFFGALGLALASGLLAWVLVYRLLAPLQVLRDQVWAIRSDQAGIGVLRHGRKDEIGELGRAFYELMAERELAEKLRSASEKRLRTIADNLPVLIAYLDSERRFRFGNATFEKWFGISPQRLVGMTVSEVMGEEAARQIHETLERAFAGNSATCDMRIEIRGTLRYLQGTYIPDVQPDGRVAGVYALKHDMTHVKEVEEQLQQLARIDSLTGIANRLMFGEILPHALDRARRHGKLLALAYLDIDHFKSINDSYGHGIGDEVLKEFARRLTRGVRATDTPARLSGDEFVVILEDLGSREEAEHIVAKIVAAMRAPFATSKGAVQASTSIGVALSTSVGIPLSQPRHSQEQLLAAADSALYAAKGKGRDGYAVYEE
ncbi:sensor domain-containing diguanylate cyclase [Massilia niastensis]|uniref:sensor domain-containing diguanylate cyclase n=1 Tax=Massilia niastensis TaxID=544911 RepID=UPI001E2CF35C|nr:sensor domain-containing diguanylate cyclase [Massilia niastensis]